MRVLAIAAVVLLAPAVSAAEEQLCLAPVEYRLVGEDAPAPEKARMVREQVAAAVDEAGRLVIQVTCTADAPVVLTVSVAESGALYDIAVKVGDVAREEQYTGPFAGALKQVRASVAAVLAEVEDPPKPAAKAGEASPKPAAKAGEASPKPAAGPTPEPAETGEAEPATEPVEKEINPLWAGSLALTAAGGAALIAGVVLLIVDDPCIEESAEHGCRERFEAASAGIPLAGLGGIAVGLGIAGLVLIDRQRTAEAESPPAPAAKQAEAAAVLAPVPGGAAAGLAVAF
jgi:hypothetical protein